MIINKSFGFVRQTHDARLFCILFDRDQHAGAYLVRPGTGTPNVQHRCFQLTVADECIFIFPNCSLSMGKPSRPNLRASLKNTLFRHSSSIIFRKIGDCVLSENDPNPITLQERACIETTYPKKRQICEPIVLAICNSGRKWSVRWWGKMDCSRRRVLACIACVINRCNAIETL